MNEHCVFWFNLIITSIMNSNFFLFKFNIQTNLMLFVFYFKDWMPVCLVACCRMLLFKSRLYVWFEKFLNLLIYDLGRSESMLSKLFLNFKFISCQSVWSSYNDIILWNVLKSFNNRLIKRWMFYVCVGLKRMSTNFSVYLKKKKNYRQMFSLLIK